MLDKTKRQYTKLSASEWDAIVSIYQTGTCSLQELAAKYAVSTSAIMNQAKARAVSRRASFPATTMLAAAALSARAVPTARKSTATSAYDTAQEKIEATNRDAYSDAIAIQHLIRMAVAAIASPTTAQEAAATVRLGEQAVNALQRCNLIRRTILRMDRENAEFDAPLPELPITTMTDLEVAAMRSAQEEEDRNAGVAPDELSKNLDAHGGGDDDGAPDDIVDEDGDTF